MRKKVLLVDDQVLDLALTRQALKDCSIEHDIVSAGDGFEGLTQLRSREFDVVVLDLKMPKVDGFEVLSEIRLQPTLAKTPVIVLSNSDLLSDRMRADALGAVEYVHKSLDYADFKHKLQTALGRHGFC
ncbi:response regulator [Massilia sp. Mn16-1_5]|uniref:response regulator n=1 Tax=Massilia sp. Mn16-1_5 TaxID=2079199 RepID=UPI00109E5B89|nr:response regulator [Massilia sp. Mn16-1_5]THC46686.1 two-component system response regulator [Massilia sp. Mn16-1_5]